MNDKEKQEKSSYEKLRFLATLFVLCLSTMAWAQMKVTGTVVDMMGEPIIGANVVESLEKACVPYIPGTDILRYWWWLVKKKKKQLKLFYAPVLLFNLGAKLHKYRISNICRKIL